MDPRRAPRVLARHPEDESADLVVDGRPAKIRVRLESPEEPKALAMPADNGLRSNEAERGSPGWPHLGKQDPECAIERTRTRMGLGAHRGELLPEGQILEGEVPAAQKRHRPCTRGAGARSEQAEEHDGRLPGRTGRRQRRVVGERCETPTISCD